MKNLNNFVLSVCLLVVISIQCSAQCTIDPTDTVPGFSPKNIQCIAPVITYGQSQQLFIPTSINNGSIIIDSIVITNITGMPAGITYTLNPASGVIHGGQVACIWFSGSTNATGGKYGLTVVGTATTNVGPLPLSSYLQDTLQICTNVSSEVYTMGHDPLGSYNFNLYGAVNTNGLSANYAFVYSTDSTFTTFSTTPLQSITDTTLMVVWATVTGLSPATTYYYYLQQGSAGKHMQFYTDTIPYVLENTGADVYGATYAELNGLVNHLQGTVNLSFEYGPTPDLGIVTASNTPTVSDTNTHTFRGYPSPLNAGTLYFYRVKAQSGTDSSYSDIRAFYMGNPYTMLQALPATNITNTGATLNGLVQGFPLPIKINSGIDQSGLSYHFHSPLQYFATDTALIHYSYSAGGLAPNTYYACRLKVDSWIGNYYSDSAFTTLITGIEELSNTNAQMSVYPNPSNGTVFVGFQSGSNEASTIQLFDIKGQLVRAYRVPDGENKYTISATDLDSGFYLVKIISGSITATSKLALIK